MSKQRGFLHNAVECHYSAQSSYYENAQWWRCIAGKECAKRHVKRHYLMMWETIQMYPEVNQFPYSSRM